MKPERNDNKNQINDPKHQANQKSRIQIIKDYLSLHYSFRLNVLTNELEYRGVKDDKFQLLTSKPFNTILVDMMDLGYKVNEKTLEIVINSDFTKDYNPFEDYFNNLPAHDGHDYIQDLCNTVVVSDLMIDDIHLRHLWKPYLTKWLVATIACALTDNVNGTALILAGDQGFGKSKWLNKLCPDYLLDYLDTSHINPSLTDNVTCNRLAEKLLVNVDDQFEQIFGKDFNAMKAIITAPYVTNRKAWHRFAKKRKRVCSFMGSVNANKFLTDGQNRRYLVFSVDQTNYNHTIDMDGVWAQALQLYKQGYQYWFDIEEINKLNKVNEIFREASPEEEWLSRLFQPCKDSDPKALFLMSSEILTILNAHSGMKLSSRRLSHALQHLKFGTPIAKRIKNVGVRRVYPVIQLNGIDNTSL